MPRIRTLKPELADDETLGSVTRDARLLFVVAITRADDHGRLRGSPRWLRATCYPYDDNVTFSDVQAWLDELVDAGLVARYVVHGETFARFVNWAKHQRVDNAGREIYPRDPDEPEKTLADLHEHGDGQDPADPSGAGPGPANSEPSRTGPQTPADSVGEIPLGPRTKDLGPRTGDHLHQHPRPVSTGQPRAGRGRDGGPPGFEQFWTTWPAARRTRQPSARNAFAAAVRAGTPAATILAGAERFAAWWDATGKDPQFIPTPTRWLTDRCWEDPTPTANGNGRRRSGHADAVGEFLARDRNGHDGAGQDPTGRPELGPGTGGDGDR